LQDWAHLRNEIFGTTFEPVAMVYNKKRLTPAEVPHTHAQLAELLKSRPARFSGKIVTYDVARTGSGFLFITQDIKQYPGAWNLVQALGASKVRLMTSTNAMLDRISSGECLLGYNLIGSYALTRALHDPNIGVTMPKDYTLVISRLIFISKHAPHPNAARLWVDYLLSRRGQTLMAEKANLHSVRNDIEGTDSGAQLYKLLGRAIKPVVVGPGLLTNLDHAKRIELLKRWSQTMAAP
jgi:iron(III) transport system substrate-binding protein